MLYFNVRVVDGIEYAIKTISKVIVTTSWRFFPIKILPKCAYLKFLEY